MSLRHQVEALVNSLASNGHVDEADLERVVRTARDTVHMLGRVCSVRNALASALVDVVGPEGLGPIVARITAERDQ